MENSNRANLAIIISVISMAVAVGSLFASFQANAISKQANDRSSGRILPYFDVACDTRHLGIVAGTPDADNLLIRITNDGAEPIQKIRFEISTDLLWSGDRANKDTTKPERSDHETTEIIQPGSTVAVNILPYVVDHFAKVPPPPGANPYWTNCRVTFSAQIVGTTHFASAAQTGKSNFCTFSVTYAATKSAQMQPLNFGVGRPKR